MSTLSFTVTDHDIAADNQGELAQSSHNFDTCAFTFDSTWESYTKYVVFYRNPSKVYKVELVNNSCKIPIDVLIKVGKLFIGARGEKRDGTSIATTKMVSFWVRNGAIDGNTVTTETVEAATLAGIKEIQEARDEAIQQIKNESPGSVTNEQVSTAVQKYLTENPISGLDASTAEQNQIPVADGNGNWSWQTQQSGTDSEETDPTVSLWAKQPNKPTYTASEVGADPSGTATSKVNEHNASSTAHNDIRALVSGLTSRLNALANSDDTTLDQLSEIVAYIKSNKSLIDSITTSKVSVSDIVDNLTSSDAKKPLSAKQGTALKALVDAITIPEKLPNPNSLSITVNGTTEIYDGSEPKIISIASGTGSSDVEIDESLTISGKAADAKVTGDRLDSIDDKISDLLYEEIEITSFSNNANTAEMGSTVNNVTLNWKTNKTPTALTLDSVSIDASATSKALTALNLTANKTWTLKVTDERNATSQKTTTLNFYNGIYYGVATESTYNNEFVLALTKILSGTKARTFTVNAGANQYIYYCLPSRLGTPSFNVGGFDGGFTKVTTISFTNSSSYTESYDIWKSDNANLGSTTVKVS